MRELQALKALLIVAHLLRSVVIYLDQVGGRFEIRAAGIAQ